MHHPTWGSRCWALLSILGLLVTACGGTHAATRAPLAPPRAEVLPAAHERAAPHKPLPPESTELDILFAAQNTRDCDAEHIECFHRCWRKKPPYPYTRGAWDHHDYCESKCLKEYMTCLERTGQRIREFRTMGRALAWLDEHKKEILIGTIVIAAGVTLVVASGGSGALVLVPLTAL